MSRSSLRLVFFSVVACWAIGLVVSLLHLGSQEWTKEKVQRDGVFLAHDILEQTAQPDRVERLRELQDHFFVGLEMISLDELERRIGRQASFGETIPHRESLRRAWYFIVFEDGSGALAAGPTNLARPKGVPPIGLFLVFVLLPALGTTVAFRIRRGITTVERANQALAVGDLSVRVAENDSSSNELASSFNTMAERMETLIKSRDELVQAVSHELGSPLSRLRFHVDLLESESATKRIVRAQAITQELNALDKLVAELLSYVQSDSLEPNRQTFEPNQGLIHLAELVRYEVPDNRAIDMDLQLQPGISVFADQLLFFRAIENLLRNAAQHARGKVSLQLSREGPKVHVSVHDDGPGIPEALREKVMAPFFRLEADRDRKTGGVGLGLAIAGRIVQQHNGETEISASHLGGAKVMTVWDGSLR